MAELDYEKYQYNIGSESPGTEHASHTHGGNSNALSEAAEYYGNAERAKHYGYVERGYVHPTWCSR
jgi:hypothetical protein